MNPFKNDDIPWLTKATQGLRFEAVAYAEGKIRLEDFQRSARTSSMPGMYMTVTHLGDRSDSQLPVKEVIYGVNKCLGYDEAGYDLRKSLSIVRDPYRAFMVEYAKAAYHLLTDEMVRKNVRQDVAYEMMVIVNHERHRRPVIVRRRSCILSNDSGELLPVQINCCWISETEDVGAYRAVVPVPRVIHGSSGYFERLIDQLKRSASPVILGRIQQEVRGKALLTPSQTDVAKCLNFGMKTNEIAEKLGKSPRTISKYNMEILERVNQVFPLLRFTEASHAADYLAQTHLMDFLPPGHIRRDVQTAA